MRRRIFQILYKICFKPIAFRLDPEKVHDTIAAFGKKLGKYKITQKINALIFVYKNKKLEQNILGIDFPNPVGLSEGFDKQAELLDIIPSVGFGFMQIGTVTLNPYDGNPKPRLARLPKSKSLIVNYGLKSDGVKKIISRIKKSNSKIIKSISIGYTNLPYTRNIDAATKDYIDCFNELIKENIGDFYTINISCPNTHGGEQFTTPERLEKLLSKITQIKTTKPIFIKMPINLSWEEFDQLLLVIKKYQIKGLIIGNLNKDRVNPKIIETIPDIAGNFSGKPTEDLANNLIQKTYQNYKNDFVIIGVGGIFSAEDAYKKIKLGASLVQIVTGMIFEGPQLIGQINEGLVACMEKDGYANISEAIGQKTTK